MVVSCLLLIAVGAAGHGMLTFPPSRIGGNLHDAAAYGDMVSQNSFSMST